MGSTGCIREPGLTNLQWLRQEMVSNPEYGEILDCATVKLRNDDWSDVIYAAWKLGLAHGDENGKVIGLIVLTGRHDGWYIYKSISETMGPSENECPKRILDLLSPLAPEDADPAVENNWAAQWRARCWANVERRASRPTVRAGDTVRFAKPLQFTNGDELDTFTFVERTTFRGPYGGIFRISRWKDREFEVVQRVAA